MPSHPEQAVVSQRPSDKLLTELRRIPERMYEVECRMRDHLEPILLQEPPQEACGDLKEQDSPEFPPFLETLQSLVGEMNTRINDLNSVLDRVRL